MIKSKGDEDEYWNSSKFKAFTFDDDDDEFSKVRHEPLNIWLPLQHLGINMFVYQLKESKQAVNSIRRLVEEDDDEDDVEKVSWSGEPVGSE